MRTQTIHAATAPNILWNEDNLIERLCGALDFAEHTVQQLGRYEEDAELPAGIDFVSLIAEIAQLLLAASNVASYAAVGPRVQRIATLLVPHARSPHIVRAICLQPATAFDHATAHICLTRLGFYDSDFDAILDLSTAAQASQGRERTPHRMIEQEWLKQGWLFPEGLPRMKGAAAVVPSALNRTLDLLHGTREDAQAFTRALICLRDHNRYPRPLPRAREEILDQAEGLLARCLAQQDYDLAAELLLAWPLTGDSWSAAATFTFCVVMNANHAGRTDCFSTQNMTSLCGLGMLCAACLAPGRRPSVHIAPVSLRSGVLAAVMTCLDSDQRTSWRDELERRDVAEREALAEFLLTVALHSAIDRREYAELERVLCLAKRLGLHPGPVACQAAEMLARLKQCGLAFPVRASFPSSDRPGCAGPMPSSAFKEQPEPVGAF